MSRHGQKSTFFAVVFIFTVFFDIKKSFFQRNRSLKKLLIYDLRILLKSCSKFFGTFYPLFKKLSRVFWHIERKGLFLSFNWSTKRVIIFYDKKKYHLHSFRYFGAWKIFAVPKLYFSKNAAHFFISRWKITKTILFFYKRFETKEFICMYI